jgi:RNA polymerase sigma-70 factor (ECF subfamily)
LAVLILMERLSPIERAAYVLREAFSYPHAEIAQILDITESASQQHVHRAGIRVTAERRGDEVDPASTRRIVEEFLAAATSGHTERLVALLTDDATAVSDGFGLARRLLRYDTRERVASYVRAGLKPTPAKRRLAGGTPVFRLALVNGSPAVLAVTDDQVVGAVAFKVRDGKVASLHGIAAADRLVHLNRTWQQHRPDAPVISAW